MQSNLPWLSSRLETIFIHTHWVAWPLLFIAAVLGVIALFSPDRFRRIATSGSRWVDTNSFFQKLDTPVNIDQTVLRHSRVFGCLVVGSTLFLAYVLFQRFGM